MSRQLTIRIADVVVRATAQQPDVCLRAGFPDSRFLVNDLDPALDLKVTAGPLPPPVEGDVLFRSRDAWSLTRTPERLWLQFGADALEHGEGRVVQMDHGLTCGELAVSTRLASGIKSVEGGYVVDPFFSPVLELLTHWQLARAGGACFHASAVVLDGMGLAFAGESEAGKSTIARLLVAGGARMLSDDRVALGRSDEGLLVHGTPWHGSPGACRPVGAPLRGFFFIEHGERNSVVRLRPSEACAELVVAGCPPYFSRELMDTFVDNCAAVAESVPCFRLAFVPDRGVVGAVREALAT